MSARGTAGSAVAAYEPDAGLPDRAISECCGAGVRRWIVEHYSTYTGRRHPVRTDLRCDECERLCRYDWRRGPWRLDP